jgi:Beta-lactamase
VNVSPSDGDIRQILRQRVDAQGKGIGMLVGVIESSGARVVSYGQIAEGEQRPPDGDTAFEIGSMTKVFTALVLADIVRRSEVALDDPIAKHLPGGARIPARNGQPITLLDVATYLFSGSALRSNISSLYFDRGFGITRACRIAMRLTARRSRSSRSCVVRTSGCTRICDDRKRSASGCGARTRN